jgi:thiol-disulfide isomerase/thioredoxin
MKKTIMFLTFLFIAVCNMAQTCVISGTVKDTAIKEVHVGLLYGEIKYTGPNLHIRVAPDGHFKQSIPLPYPVFAMLKAGQAEQLLLLSAGRDLQLHIDTGAKNTIRLSGKAAIENDLVHHSILDTTPFFLKAKWSKEKQQYDEDLPYTKVTVSTWQELIMNRVQQDITTATNNIQQAAIPAAIKKILNSETGYAWQHHLFEFIANPLRFSKNKDRDSLTTLALQWKPLPDSLTLVNGNYASLMAGWHYHFTLERIVKNSGNKEMRQSQIGALLGTSYTTIDSLVKLYDPGTVQSWFYASHHQPRNVQDKVLFNNIIKAAYYNTLPTGLFMLELLQQNYPHSNYLSQARVAVQGIKDKIKTNANNARIVFKNASGIQSLRDLVKPYAGKIVFLDMWGTWCAPCKKEMPYTYELKQKYAGKDIVFVYLDKDEANKEQDWKEYVRSEALEGEHYRMNKTAIQAIWNDIQATGEQRLHTYPTYMIIDRQGNIVNTNAEKPSSRQKLYAQLDKLL